MAELDGDTVFLILFAVWGVGVVVMIPVIVKWEFNYPEFYHSQLPCVKGKFVYMAWCWPVFVPEFLCWWLFAREEVSPQEESFIV